MKEIGGYFEIELNKIKNLHKSAIALNTARNSLEYILRTRKYKKIYLPRYICDVILEPIQKLKIDYEYYSINNFLEPIFNKKIFNNEGFLYVNYFGIKQKTIKNIKKMFNNLIIDNSQAFFAKPLKNIDTFYSARKFFGVADGAYLYTNLLLKKELKTDVSCGRMKHLLKRVDFSANQGYEYFKQAEESLKNQPIKKMSKLTKRILNSIDYSFVKKARKRNFNFIHSQLKEINELNIDITDGAIPMAYPFLFKSGKIREKLIDKKIYIATYWSNLLKEEKTSLEYYLAKNLIALPIDQRYDFPDMQNILNIIKHYAN